MLCAAELALEQGVLGSAGEGRGMHRPGMPGSAELEDSPAPTHLPQVWDGVRLFKGSSRVCLHVPK